MKRIFLAIGMAALMFVSGTNVYLANQKETVSSELTLEDVEASGYPIVEDILKYIFGESSSSESAKVGGTIATNRVSDFYPNGTKRQGTFIYCPSAVGVFDCDPSSFRPRTHWDDGSITYSN